MAAKCLAEKRVYGSQWRSESMIGNKFMIASRAMLLSRMIQQIISQTQPRFGKIPKPMKVELALPPPPLPKSPPPKTRNFMGMGFSSRKNQKMPGAHKICAAISSPRIAGGKITDMRLFSSERLASNLLWPRRWHSDSKMRQVCDSNRKDSRNRHIRNNYS